MFIYIVLLRQSLFKNIMFHEYDNKAKLSLVNYFEIWGYKDVLEIIE